MNNASLLRDNCSSIEWPTVKNRHEKSTHLLEANNLDDAWNKARAHWCGPGTDKTVQILAVELEEGAAL
jgi:hypothetical protein